jgi:S-adenosylmethionine:tRNA ribosyltransferase-isomerase
MENINIIGKAKLIETASFDYNLPDHRIARYPLTRREDSKLLVLKDDKIIESNFYNIGDFLPEKAMMVFNDTKVVRARLLFRKSEGAVIELFTLEPASDAVDLQIAFAQHSSVKWKCLVGNSKRWKSGVLEMILVHPDGPIRLVAERLQRESDYSVISFSWDKPEASFAEILDLAGEMPLPPYLNRKAEISDLERYQTVFAMYEGSVAAPTAGLHLTEDLIKKLKSKDIQFEQLTLHVGAGTFKPLTSVSIGNHTMHAEKISISRASVIHLLEQSGNPIIAIGTTSLRTLESLYWIATLIKKNMDIQDIRLDQWFPYQNHVDDVSDSKTAFQQLLNYLDYHHSDNLQATTSILIVPGYKFKIVNGLVTNFHQPMSTLLLLVSALIGDKWKKVYQYALENDFRFLSYGDSCLFMKEKENQ